MSEPSGKIDRRVYSTELKQEAVRLVMEPGLNGTQTGRKLGVPAKTLANWDRPRAGNTASLLWHSRKKRGISMEMVVMLGKAFGTSASLWMDLQQNWKLSQVDVKNLKRVRKLRLSA